ncbi:conserved hypothetical protein [Verticillium alfalfae VaMs.102]|uniref:Uncharacterized protein n=1 Tax=Verticillium alfalfae (strain VaMs.102 / ATCC MYA-4576 / FGSC 10136) TaxID=526221 RepID=C9SED0_VERA1|nr:conserved hypothetical protein [Verticillium alfalfae VaMs.102]EEY16523.1 conserved hypothetical protein [Verticillium alfalfae VaMs.102]
MECADGTPWSAPTRHASEDQEQAGGPHFIIARQKGPQQAILSVDFRVQVEMIGCLYRQGETRLRKVTSRASRFSGRKAKGESERLASKEGKIQHMTPELWQAKKIVDSTLHPDTGEAVFLPFRMSSFVLSNLIVTAGMLQPGLGNGGTIAWQVVNHSLKLAINSANAN